tara:strand:- start:10898 stop:11326 length:429 start_codon:yes stop_codon:yes gene_type:complete
MKYERIEVEVAEGIAWLCRITPRQMIALGDSLWSETRKRLIQDMKDADIESAERMKCLEEHDRKRGLMSEVIHYAVTAHGSLEIIKLASENEESENADGLPESFIGTTEDAIRIALELIGTQIDNDSNGKSKKKAEKKSQNG